MMNQRGSEFGHDVVSGLGDEAERQNGNPEDMNANPEQKETSEEALRAAENDIARSLFEAWRSNLSNENHYVKVEGYDEPIDLAEIDYDSLPQKLREDTQFIAKSGLLVAIADNELNYPSDLNDHEIMEKIVNEVRERYIADPLAYMDLNGKTLDEISPAELGELAKEQAENDWTIAAGVLSNPFFKNNS